MKTIIALPLVVRFRHLHPFAALSRANVGITRTTSKILFSSGISNLTFDREPAAGWVSNVKSIPLVLSVSALPIGQTAFAAGDPQAVDLMPVLEPVVGAVISIVGVMAAWALKRLADRLGLDVRADSWGEIEEAIRWATARSRRRVLDEGQDLTSVNVRSQMTAEILAYVVGHAPVAVKRLGVTRQTMEEMVEAWLSGEPESAGRQ